jgi:Uma2 family endonuclease
MSAVVEVTVSRRLLGKPWADYAPQVTFNFGAFLKKMDDDEFFEFCRENSELRIEMDERGAIEIMPPTGTETGGRNFTLTGKFAVWVEKDGTGKGFDSSTGFRLPNGAKRSPDLSWVKSSKWKAVPKDKRKRFAPLCPDFVVEIRSETDSLTKLKNKMQEYIENGAALGWLIDPMKRRVYVYRPNAEVETLENPKTVSGEPLLEGFTLFLKEIWD